MKPLKIRVKGTNTSFREVTGFEVGNHLLLRAELVEFEEEPSKESSTTNVNWEQVRINTAIAVFQSIISNPAFKQTPNEERCMEKSAILADLFAKALIKQLKK